jgi:hypothetical protein
MMRLHLSPGGPMFEHGVEDRQNLAYAGGERHLFLSIFGVYDFSCFVQEDKPASQNNRPYHLFL